MNEEFLASVDELVDRNQTYAESFSDGDLASAPQMRLLVVACMDARMNIPEILGLKTGDAHILRNAGGLVTDDVIRSICCLLYTSPSPRDRTRSRMPSSA